MNRYYSLDVFRGATVALMILVNNPGSWSYIYPPLQHAKWHGCTPTDLVFPFFLFAVGNAMAFVMPKFEEKGSRFFWRKLLIRSFLIFFIGIFLNWSPFVKWNGDELVVKPWETVRILGVLQRIAIAYFFSSIIVYYAKAKGSFLIGVLILLLYWILTYFLGNPTNPYTLSGYFGTSIDKIIIGESHMYKGEGVLFDPEGLTSTLPAITQVILGYIVGTYILQKGKTYDMLSQILLAGIAFVMTGFIWDISFPINKKIWTSSYVIYTSGIALFALGLLIYVLEFKNKRGVWSHFFDVFGKNPLFIFVLSGFLPRVLALIRWIDHFYNDKPVYTSPFPWFYQHICKPVSIDPRNASLLYAVCMIIFYWFIAYILDKKKIYIKV
jgi:predicted acyltransferase